MKEHVELLVKNINAACEVYGSKKNEIDSLGKTNDECMLYLKEHVEEQYAMRKRVDEYNKLGWISRLWNRLFYPFEQEKLILDYIDLNAIRETLNDKIKTDFVVEGKILLSSEVRISIIGNLVSMLSNILGGYGKRSQLRKDFSSVYPVLGLLKIEDIKEFPLTVSADVNFPKTPAIDQENFSEQFKLLQYAKIKLVKQMIDCLKEMKQANLSEMALHDPAAAKAYYDNIMERFNGVLKLYKRNLLFPTHPDKQSNDNGELFKKLQPIYEKYQGYKKAIEEYVEKYGLKGLSACLPSDEELLASNFDNLYASFEEKMEKYDAYIDKLNAWLAGQDELINDMKSYKEFMEKKLDAFIEEMASDEARIESLRQDMVGQDVLMEGLKEDETRLSSQVEIQSEEIDRQKKEIKEIREKMPEDIKGEVARLMQEMGIKGGPPVMQIKRRPSFFQEQSENGTTGLVVTQAASEKPTIQHNNDVRKLTN
jgi:hypothetical protein